MPPYPWLAQREYDPSAIGTKIRAMQKLGVPYPKDYDQQAAAAMMTQSKTIGDGLRATGVEVTDNKEIIALIAYLQRLGTDIKAVQQPLTGQ